MSDTIEARGLTKRYGDKLAVDDLTFTVEPGRVTGFLGPNGAGKSTTMRLVLGLDAATSGSVTVHGRPYPGLPRPLHTVGALLDARAVHPGRTAANHLLALAQTAGIGRKRVDAVLELVGLADVAGKRAGTFSLGMSQRLGIAAALLGDPPVLMFDEPVNGLDLLLLAQLDERGLELHRAPMDLRTLAADALHDLRALDPTREIRLTGLGTAEDPGPAPVLGDESRLRQVVSNLVGNAIAHTQAGTPVRIGVGTTDGAAVLEPSDQGPGLPREQARLVFERFYRADTSRARDHGGGAGLGLAIVLSLVTAHDGTVEMDTSPGEGATFRISFPTAVVPG